MGARGGRGSRGSLRAHGQSKKLRDHTSNHKDEAESELELGQGYKLSNPAPSDMRLLIASSNSFRNQRTGVQMYKLTVDTSNSKHHTLKTRL